MVHGQKGQAFDRVQAETGSKGKDRRVVQLMHSIILILPSVIPVVGKHSKRLIGLVDPIHLLLSLISDKCGAISKLKKCVIITVLLYFYEKADSFNLPKGE